MLNLKKICYFIIGLVFIPLVFSAICAFITTSDYEDNIDFFGGMYLIVYLLFPLLYRGKLKNIIINKYVFYGLLYLPFIILFYIARIL